MLTTQNRIDFYCFGITLLVDYHFKTLLELSGDGVPRSPQETVQGYTIVFLQGNVSWIQETIHF